MADLSPRDVEGTGYEEPSDYSSEFSEPMDPNNIGNYMTELPVEVKRRVLALKKLQVDVMKLRANFFKEVHALEEKYLPLYQPFFEKRGLITSGQYEPTPEECDHPGIEGLLNDLGAISLDKEKNGVAETEPADKPVVAGIPEFWLKIFTNVDLLADMLEETDLPIIKHLLDIKVESSTDPMGFKLNFHFEPNEFFSNSVLTKTYGMKCEIDPEDPFAFEGPEIVKSYGSPIDWKAGKNVTVKVIKKKQKHKQRGSVRTLVKTVPAPSFFNFFSPPEVPEGNTAELDEETQCRLTNDFEVGQYIRDTIVPHAVLYYTGEALDDEDEEFEDDDDDDDEDDEDFEEEDERSDEPREPGFPGGKNDKALTSKGRRKPQKTTPQQDCKQQ